MVLTCHHIIIVKLWPVRGCLLSGLIMCELAFTERSHTDHKQEQKNRGDVLHDRYRWQHLLYIQYLKHWLWLCFSQERARAEVRDELIRSAQPVLSNKAQMLAMPQFGLRDNLIRCELLKKEDAYTYIQNYRCDTFTSSVLLYTSIHSARFNRTDY